MTNEEIRSIILPLVDQYHIRKVTLFGSRAAGVHRPDSDIDLIVEFDTPVTLLGLLRLKNHIEALTNLAVDVIHGPIRDGDMIEVGKVVNLYAA